MSETKSTTSKKAVEGSSDRSVLDFLYNDSRRIGAFLSQFEPGHLQQFKHTKSAELGQAKKSEKAGKAALPTVIEGKLSNIEEASSSTGQGFERVFDPLWFNARAFLDHLSNNDLIQGDITKATMGQFVQVTGSLIIADNAMFKFMWENPAIRSFMKSQFEAETAAAQPEGNRQERRKQQAQKPKPADVTEADLVLALLPHMPHSGHLHIVREDLAVWGSAVDDALVSPMSELVLKHGSKIAGQWSMLGILDAYPFEQEEMMTAMEMVRVGMAGENISKVALQMAPYIRQALGRPLLSYGMTPLLVYRQLPA